MSFDFSQANERIAAYEGNRKMVYPDTAGHPTIGIGFNLDRSDAASRMQAVGADYDAVRAGTESLTEQQIDTLARADIESALASAQSLISNFSSLTPARQFVLVDMIFNLGLSGFEQFQPVIAAVEAANWHKAADEMQASAWYGQVGSRAVADVEMMKAGGWDGASAGDDAATAGSGSAHAQAGPPYPGSVLRLDSSGEEVRTWQERLVGLGHPLPVDGDFGHHTEEATRQFQSSKGLTADGIVGEHTWAAAWR